MAAPSQAEVSAESYPHRLRSLCLGRTDRIAGWLEQPSLRWILFCALVVVVGCGMYGITIGLWRSPLQSFYTGLKFPLLIFLTCIGNALLNGMLGQMLGTGFSFRQTSHAILLSFTLAALILGTFSPLTLFVLANTPALDSVQRGAGHSLILLTHVLIIAYAGVMANYRLLQLLQTRSASRTSAVGALFAWLGGNLLLGAQLSWVLRPFIGSPGLPVQFLRDEPLRGNFFEAVWKALKILFTNS